MQLPNDTIEVPADRVHVSTQGNLLTLEVREGDGFAISHRLLFTPRQALTLIRHIAFDLDEIVARLDR